LFHFGAYPRDVVHSVGRHNTAISTYEIEGADEGFTMISHRSNARHSGYGLYTGKRGICMLTFLNCPDNPTCKESFERCCNEYEQLFFASAYCDWPQGSLLNHPVKRLNSITAVLAPHDGLRDPRIGFRELAIAMKEDGKEVHVHEFTQSQFFHPKFYVFRRSDGSRALIIGSSNFTEAAFERNVELDVLLEGRIEESQIHSLRQRFSDWFLNGSCLTGQSQCPQAR
jgi:hypothetical protein